MTRNCLTIKLQRRMSNFHQHQNMKIVGELVSLRFSFSSLLRWPCSGRLLWWPHHDVVFQLMRTNKYSNLIRQESFVLILGPGIYMHSSPHWIISCQLALMQKCFSVAIHSSFQGGTSKKKKVMSSCEGTIDLFNKSESPPCSNEAVSAKSGSNLALKCSEGGFESGLHDRI